LTDNGFDPSRSIKYYTDKGEVPAEKQIASWKHHWQFKKLSLIADNLPIGRKEFYESLQKEFGDVGHPEFHHWSSGVQDVQQTTPISKDEILNLSADALIAFLKDWQQQHPFEGPAEDRLWGALRAEVQDSLLRAGWLQFRDLGSDTVEGTPA
jgi:hypothetical protein